MTEEEFLPIQLVRDQVGVVGPDSDDRLVLHRKAAIGRVETTTSRSILDVAAVEVEGVLDGNLLTFAISDAVIPDDGIRVSYRAMESGIGFELDQSFIVPKANVRVRRSDVAMTMDRWPEKTPSTNFRAAFNVGIPNGKAPPEFQSAALFITNELYIGNAVDILPGNILELILRDHVVSKFTANDAVRINAGIWK